MFVTRSKVHQVVNITTKKTIILITHFNILNNVFLTFTFAFEYLRRLAVNCNNIRAACRTIPGLTRDQLDLCHRANDVTAVALSGLDLAVRECQTQVRRSHREDLVWPITKTKLLFNNLLHLKLYTSYVLQFQWHRWNCSSLGNGKNRNPHNSMFLRKGEWFVLLITNKTNKNGYFPIHRVQNTMISIT